MADPTPATVKNRGAAERKTKRRVEVSMTAAENQRHTEHTAQAQRTEYMEGAQKEEDEEELMQTVAEAFMQAERDEQVSHAAREAPGEVRGDARLMKGQLGIGDGIADNLLHKLLEQAMGKEHETPEGSRRRKGKAPTVEESMRTPVAARQRQAKPATTKYKAQSQHVDRQQHRAETSRAAMGVANQSDQGLRNTPWG